MTERSRWWCFAPAEIEYELLDPGVREVVRWLVALGFHTTDSGDGEHKRDHGWTEEGGLVPFPHVYMHVEPAEIVVACTDLRGCLKGIGITVVSQTDAWAEIIGGDSASGTAKPKPYIEVTYDPCNQRAVMGLFHVTSEMVATAKERAR